MSVMLRLHTNFWKQHKNTNYAKLTSGQKFGGQKISADKKFGGQNFLADKILSSGPWSVEVFD